MYAMVLWLALIAAATVNSAAVPTEQESDKPVRVILPTFERQFSVLDPSKDAEDIAQGRIIQLPQGYIRGIAEPNAPRVRKFYGVPFVAPPVGKNRLRPPAPVDPWNLQNPNTVLHTTRKSPACIQPEKVVQSEDCLYINVFTPSIDRVSGPMPVLVWFHGGAFLFGNSLNPKLTDPSYWIQHKDLVLVAFSYRVGALGFMTTDQIPANLGMMDQVAAMRWVQSNIHLFGGDDGRVTIMGQSAGAMSVGLHMTSDMSTGLFHRAIMQSNVLGTDYRNLSAAMEISKRKAIDIGCANAELACLQGLPVDVFLPKVRSPLDVVRNFFQDAQGRLIGHSLTWAPVMDGSMIKGTPRAQFAAGNFVRVPVMLGFTDMELAYQAVEKEFFHFISLKNIMLLPVFNHAVKTLFGANADAVLKAYPPKWLNPHQNTNTFITLASDYMVKCPTLQVARSIRDAGVGVYAYRFNYLASGVTQCLTESACHTSDLPLLFHMAHTVRSTRDHLMSHLMMDYVTRFIAGDEGLSVATTLEGHDVGVQSGPVPAWTSDPGSMMVFDNNGAHMESINDDGAHCALWDSTNYIF